jgi:hypothetical protein
VSVAHNVGGASRNVVSVGKGLVLSILACEEDGVAALDLHNRAITEAYRADDAGVEIREDLLDTGHVVGGPCVEDPLLGVPSPTSPSTAYTSSTSLMRCFGIDEVTTSHCSSAAACV